MISKRVLGGVPRGRVGSYCVFLHNAEKWGVYNNSSHFYIVLPFKLSMTAQEQMRKMLDQLMGSGRDGESKYHPYRLYNNSLNVLITSINASAMLLNSGTCFRQLSIPQVP